MVNVEFIRRSGCEIGCGMLEGILLIEYEISILFIVVDDEGYCD